MHVRSMIENIDPSKDFEYVFYAYDKNDPVKELGIKIPVPYTLVQTKTLKKSIDRPRDIYHLSKVILHKFNALRNHHIDVFIQFDFMLGLPRLENVKKKILVAYDLIPLIFKEDYIPTPRHEFKNQQGIPRKVKKSLRALYYQTRYRIHYDNFRKADLLLSISQNTTESLITIINLPESKIVTIPLAPVFNSSIEKRPVGLPKIDKPFIFYIGATDARKRVSDLIEAFDTVREKHDIELILAGKEFAKPKKIPSSSILEALKNTPNPKNIHTLGYVDDSEKLWLFRHATAFVFPTAYEGFGLPVIEALQNGCPVISYNNSSIPEVAGDAVRLVPTGNISQLAKDIGDIVSNRETREKMVKIGYTQSKVYTWKNYMHKFYSELI